METQSWEVRSPSCGDRGRRNRLRAVVVPLREADHSGSGHRSVSRLRWRRRLDRTGSC